MRYFLATLLVIILAQPTTAQQRPTPDDTTAFHYQLPSADCALFPAAAKLPPYEEYWVTRTGRFSPTQQQVTEIERILPDLQFTQVYNPNLPLHMRKYYAHYPAIIHKTLPDYQRQYHGFYNETHQPCFYINFFIEHVEYTPNTVPGWLRYPIHAHDGGANFWHIYYNLTTHQFYNFSHGMEG